MDKKDIVSMYTRIFEDQILFNKLLGFKILEMSVNRVEVSMEMRDELLGNPFNKTLHGGAIASILDFACGLIAQAHVVDAMPDVTPEKLNKRLSRMGTIDLRIDYIRPGRGKTFLAVSEIVRLGNKVAVIRSELNNEKHELIAVATAAYLVG